MKNKKSSSIITLVFYVLLIAIIIFAIASLFSKNEKEEVFTYGDLVQSFENNLVHSYVFDENSYEITLKLYTDVEGEFKTQIYAFSTHDYYQFFSPNAPADGDYQKALDQLGDESRLVVEDIETIVAKETPWIIANLPAIILVVLFVIFMIFSLRQTGG
ncbi:MAG: hypothetical protein J6A54_02060, partial [Clostridia bacterium]|nr:hypothetical protein [Clostridia bacterium]